MTIISRIALLTLLHSAIKVTFIPLYPPLDALIATGADDGQVVLSTSEHGEKVHSFQASKERTATVTGLQFTKSNEQLAIGTGDGVVRLWDIV